MRLRPRPESPTLLLLSLCCVDAVLCSVPVLLRIWWRYRRTNGFAELELSQGFLKPNEMARFEETRISHLGLLPKRATRDSDVGTDIEQCLADIRRETTTVNGRICHVSRGIPGSASGLLSQQVTWATEGRAKRAPNRFDQNEVTDRDDGDQVPGSICQSTGEKRAEPKPRRPKKEMNRQPGQSHVRALGTDKAADWLRRAWGGK